jgi:hypothetical protein
MVAKISDRAIAPFRVGQLFESALPIRKAQEENEHDLSAALMGPQVIRF